MNDFLSTVIPDHKDQVPEQMEPNLDIPQSKQTIATLVFMDLETTGLPGFIGKKNVHITEMSLVAVDRQDFEDDRSSPRVINKLSMCVQPRTAISYGAMQVTGLSNDLLETQQTFNDSVPKLLDIFLGRLRQPICLLAHNGRCYDFPILQAELKRLNFSLPKDILCADTLEAFRKIGLVPPNDALMLDILGENAETSNHSCKAELTDDDIEKLLSEDMHLLQNITVPHEPCLKYNYNMEAENYPSHNSLIGINRVNIDRSGTPDFKNKFIEVGAGEHTPLKTGISPPPNGVYYANRNKGETTPQSDFLLNNNQQHKSLSHAKRRLFTQPVNESNKKGNIESPSTSATNLLAVSAPPKKPAKRPQYALEKLYIHYFGELPPDNHHAESDCINLSKVCQKVSKSFLPWLDENSFPFCTTSALW